MVTEELSKTEKYPTIYEFIYDHTKLQAGHYKILAQQPSPQRFCNPVGHLKMR
ncbi:MAG: hypothetical protein WKF85_13260 [Chitinophagaceae bacterium]